MNVLPHLQSTSKPTQSRLCLTTPWTMILRELLMSNLFSFLFLPDFSNICTGVCFLPEFLSFLGPCDFLLFFFLSPWPFHFCIFFASSWFGDPINVSVSRMFSSSSCLLLKRFIFPEKHTHYHHDSSCEDHQILPLLYSFQNFTLPTLHAPLDISTLILLRYCWIALLGYFS